MSAATSPELHDRRQRALEAGLDAATGVDGGEPTIMGAIDASIETATRVRIDKTVMQAAWKTYLEGGSIEGADDPDLYDMLYAAFEAAGFEVED
jgi:hypothetical protein